MGTRTIGVSTQRTVYIQENGSPEPAPLQESKSNTSASVRKVDGTKVLALDHTGMLFGQLNAMLQADGRSLQIHNESQNGTLKTGYDVVIQSRCLFRRDLASGSSGQLCWLEAERAERRSDNPAVDMAASSEQP